MFYPQELIEQIRMENEIVGFISQYVSLKQKGGYHFGLCPFHRESTPSFSVSQDRQIYYCFGCGATGNVISFIMQKENYDFPTAIKVLAERARIPLPETGDPAAAARNNSIRNALYEIHKKAARHFYDCLQGEEGANARQYLDKRQISRKMRIKFGLGYSSGNFNKALSNYGEELLLKSGLCLKGKTGGLYDRFRNRLMFPIFDVTGRVIGFGGRIMEDGEPKYLNSPETLIFEKSKSLYGLNFAKGNQNIILVEGYMDVISLHQAGFTNAVAALGTAFNENHGKALSRYAKNVIISFDSDSAGEKAASRALPLIMAQGINASVLSLQDAKDPDELIQTLGSAGFERALENAMSHVAFSIKTAQKKYNLDNNQDKINFSKEVSAILAKLPSAVERDVYIMEAAALTGISPSAIKEEIEGRDKIGPIDDRPRQNYSYLKKPMDKGMDDAKKSIINMAAEGGPAYTVISKHLSPVEMGGGIYSSLLELIYRLQKEGKSTAPADLISFYEEIEEQKEASSVFAGYMAIDDARLLTTALNHQLKLIKSTYIDSLLNSEPDMNKAQKLLDTKRNIETLNISLDIS